MSAGDDSEIPPERTTIYRPGSVPTVPRQSLPAELRAVLPTFWKVLELRGDRRVAEAAEQAFRAQAMAIRAKIDRDRAVAELHHLDEIVADHIANIRHGFEHNRKLRELDHERLDRQLAEEKLRRVQAEERLEAKLRPKSDEEAHGPPAAFREILGQRKEHDEAKHFVEQERGRLRRMHGEEAHWPEVERHYLENLESALAQMYSRSFR